MLNGTVMSGFLSGWTLIIKVVGLGLSVSSGLNVGKEGPFVHLSSCLAFTISRLFKRFRYGINQLADDEPIPGLPGQRNPKESSFNAHRKDEALLREVLTCACAAGVAVAFAAPIGGVLFALEEVRLHMN